MVESIYVRQEMAKQIIEKLNMLWKESHVKTVNKNNFTVREVEIIQLIAAGLNSYEIAGKLYISKHTVDTHRKNIYRKGGFKGLRDVILFSILT